MVQALSEDSTLSLYEKGHKVFRSSVDLRDVSLPVVNFEAILASKDPQAEVQKLASQELYFSLKNKGLDDCLEILPLVSKEQFVKLIDYDVWSGKELSVQKLFSWLDQYKKLDPKQMIRRYRELDEEYQVASLSPYLRGYTEEEYEKMTESEQDSLFAFPGKEIYFSVVGLDEKTHESVINFFEIAGEQDIEYALSLLAELSYTPPHEAAELIFQFRKARLEEDGFITREEAREFFFPLSLEKMEKKIQELKASFVSTQKISEKILAHQGEKLFLDQVFEFLSENSKEKEAEVKKRFMFLVNSLMTASEVEPEDLSEMKQIMKIAQGKISLALEVLTDSDISFAAYLLSEKIHLKEIFRFAISYLGNMKREFLKELESIGVIQSKAYLEDLDLLKFGPLLYRLDRELFDVLGFEGTELLKAFLGRFSFAPELSKEGKSSLMLFAPVSSKKDLERMIASLKVIQSLLKKEKKN